MKIAGADLVIADGKNLLWRTHDVDQHSMARDGQTAIGGAEGFLRLLLKLQRTFKGKVIVAWEGRGVNWRMAFSPDYKANRSKRKPEQIAEHEQVMRQIPILQELLAMIGVRQWQGVDCEGDDVIATLATNAVTATMKAQHSGFPRSASVVIYSRDRDLLQLVNDAANIRQLMPEGTRKNAGFFMDDNAIRCDLGRLMHEADVLEVIGVDAKLISDLKGLAGDPGDNIPGVRGIGNGKATELIREFGDLEAILTAAADGCLDDRANLRNKLLDNVGPARKCKILASVKRDATIEELPPRLNEDDAHARMLELGMRAFMNSAQFTELMTLSR